ncbi:DNA-processing protein DprA [Aliiroseovarius sp. YM-037]|uniref:DNA-processing protein DprA n=1 Tax=Aliiroseovarius sp. YM-037 TaxID=3341728 RepID=UPI003A80CC8F
MTDDLFNTDQRIKPPNGKDEQLAWLRLIRSRRVGVATFFRLMRDHGTAERALEALPEIAKAAGVEKYETCPIGVAQAEMKAAARVGARLLCYGAPDYPKHLMDIPDAPPLLWARGDVELLTRPMVALVGARNASSLGTRMARRLAADLTEAGFAVVSGLARGIDAAAHKASIETGTIAVIAGGIDTIYPAENADLAAKIHKSGLTLSEQPVGMQPMARHFPLRNRIISGVSRGVVVVEAALKSGSLITARNALDQGREVLAVPGHPFDARASGCNALIRDGATLVRSVEDIVEQLGGAALPAESAVKPPARQAEAPPKPTPDVSDLHQQILSRLGPSPLAEDQLIRDLGIPAKTVNPELTTLELDGRIERKHGGLLALVG